MAKAEELADTLYEQAIGNRLWRSSSRRRPLTVDAVEEVAWSTGSYEGRRIGFTRYSKQVEEFLDTSWVANNSCTGGEGKSYLTCLYLLLFIDYIF